MNWAAVIPALLGTLVGGGISLVTTFLTLRHQAKVERGRQAHQAKLELDKRVHERERAAVIRARDAVMKLLQLESNPGQHLDVRLHRNRISSKEYIAELEALRGPYWDWKTRRGEMLSDFQMAIDDFSDDGLREALDDVHLTLSLADSAWREIGSVESVTRRIACHQARECLARFSQDRELPAVEGPYAQALEAVKDWLADQEHFAEMRQEERDRKALEAEKRFMETLPDGKPTPEVNP